MQKIGEHLDSGDDTSICATPVTSALQFLPCGGVRSAGHLPSFLAEAWGTGMGLSLTPSLVFKFSVPYFHSSARSSPLLYALTLFSLSKAQVSVAPSAQRQSSPEKQ